MSRLQLFFAFIIAGLIPVVFWGIVSINTASENYVAITSAPSVEKSFKEYESRQMQREPASGTEEPFESIEDLEERIQWIYEEEATKPAPNVASVDRQTIADYIGILGVINSILMGWYALLSQRRARRDKAHGIPTSPTATD